MFKKFYNLLKILRKLEISGAVETLEEFKHIPKSWRFVFFIFSLVGTNNTKNLKIKYNKKMQIHKRSNSVKKTKFVKIRNFSKKISKTSKK